MKFICPLITTTDIKKSKSFYENVLEQKVKYDFGENITFEGDFAIHLKSHYKNLIGNKNITSGSNSFELYFEFDDLSQIEEKLIHHKVEFIHPIREEPWRQRVMRFYDPDQNIIEVGESVEHLVQRLYNDGLSISEISESTSFPAELVRALIPQI